MTIQEKKGKIFDQKTPSPDLMDESQIEEKYNFNLADIPVMIIFWALVIIVFLQFFTRYVLNDSLGWTEEISRYLLISLGFIGSVTVVRKGGHIFLEFFYRFIPSKLTKLLVVLSQLVSSIFYGYCAYLSAQIALRIHQKLVTVALPKSVVYWIICICFILMTIHSLVWLFKRLKQNHHELANSLNDQIILN